MKIESFFYAQIKDGSDRSKELSFHKGQIIYSNRGLSMKLNHLDIAILSSMICGDHPYKSKFPYRNAEKLAVFFQNIGLNYSYDKTLPRKKWVELVLEDLNDKADPKENILSIELKTVIRGVLDPNDYTDLRYTDFEKAKKLLDKFLKQHKITLNAIIDSEIDEDDKKIPTSTQNKNVSQKSEEQFLKIIPQVFTIPKKKVDNNLVSVMMPFSKDFQDVYDSIKLSCENANMICQRADNVWKNSMIIQDIFELIFTSSIVVADFSTRNPNVFYEVGIAHTLGKHVIPIAQSMDDIPFDLHHHRVLVYHNNNEGRNELSKTLSSRIITIKDEFLSSKK
jgi:hypothetical protein